MFRWFEGRLDPFPTAPIAQPPATLWSFIAHYVRPVGAVFALLLFLDLLAALTEVALAAYVARLIDLMQSASAAPATFIADHAGALAWMAFVVLVARPLVIIAYELVKNQVLSPPFQARVRWQTHAYLLRQSLGYFQNDFAGRIANKLMQTGNALRDLIVQVSDAAVFVAVQWVAALALFWVADKRLVLPLLAWLAAYVLVLAVFVPRIRARSTEASEARSMLLGRIVDSYTNILTVKLFAHAEREDDYARSSVASHMAKQQAYVRLTTLMVGTLFIVNGILVVGTTALAVWLWTTASISLGAIALVTALVIRITQMSTWVLGLVTNIFENIGVVQEGMEAIARPHAVTDRTLAPALAVPEGAIVFDRVGFHYGGAKGLPDADPNRIFDGLSLAIRPGEKIGLVGRSGSGKSTLVSLLLRFHDLERGRITIDGQDIAGVTQDSLRAAIGMVTQDTSLLHRSVLDNILYGRPEAGIDAAIVAAKRAHAHDFILGLEDKDGRKGYDARVGERGVKLSGGQRQRIAIARVLLKDAPILVLDEATSALDSEAEAVIQEQFTNLMLGKTVITIAHRLSTIAAMDRLIVLDQGRIIEQGSHGALLARGGVYAGLWLRQSGGFVDADAVKPIAAE